MDLQDDDATTKMNAVLEELLQKAEGKDAFKTVLKELLQKRDEVNTANEKVARLESALSVKEDMQAKHEKAMEKAQLRHERAMGKAQLRHESAMREERSMQEKMMEQNRMLIQHITTGTKGTAAGLDADEGRDQQSHHHHAEPSEASPIIKGPPRSEDNSSDPSPEEQKALKFAATEAPVDEIYHDEEQQQQRQHQQEQELPPVNAPRPESDRSAAQNETTDNGAIGRPRRPTRQPRPTERNRTHIDELEKVAVGIYDLRTNDVKLNRAKIQRVVDKYPLVFSPILERNPHFVGMLAHMLVLRFEFRVQEVSWVKEMRNLDAEDNRRVGRAMAPILRMVQTNDAAVDAWRSNYPQLQTLFDGVSALTSSCSSS